MIPRRCRRVWAVHTPDEDEEEKSGDQLDAERQLPSLVVVGILVRPETNGIVDPKGYCEREDDHQVVGSRKRASNGLGRVLGKVLGSKLPGVVSMNDSLSLAKGHSPWTSHRLPHRPADDRRRERPSLGPPAWRIRRGRGRPCWSRPSCGQGSRKAALRVERLPFLRQRLYTCCVKTRFIRIETQATHALLLCFPLQV